MLEEADAPAVAREAWKACRSEEMKPEGKTAYGVKFSPDGAVVSLCGAVCPKEGKARISMIRQESTAKGIRWLADWLNQRYGTACCVVIDGKNGVDVLVDRIADTWRAKGSVVRPGVRDVVAAASLLTNELGERTVTWYAGQPALEDSALGATRRAVGGGWAFGGDNSTPIEAAALALWGCRTSKRDPARKMKVGC